MRLVGVLPPDFQLIKRPGVTQIDAAKIRKKLLRIQEGM